MSERERRAFARSLARTSQNKISSREQRCVCQVKNENKERWSARPPAAALPAVNYSAQFGGLLSQ